jgi:hypothetical protein
MTRVFRVQSKYACIFRPGTPIAVWVGVREEYMKFRVYVLAFLLSLTAPLMAEERETFDMKQQPKVQKYSISEPWRYIFRDYIVDLKVSVRKDEVQSGDLISHPASNLQQEYKPLNPIIVSW